MDIIKKSKELDKIYANTLIVNNMGESAKLSLRQKKIMNAYNERFCGYINQVLQHPENHCKLVRLAIERHLKDRDANIFNWAPEVGYKICHEIESQYCFYNKQWAGQPVKLEDWQVFSLMLRYGWRIDGEMRFTRGYEEIARKNGKSIKKGWELLYHLRNFGAFGLMVNGATTEKQARIVINAAGQTAKASPKIADEFKWFFYKNLITKLAHLESQSMAETLTSQAGKLDGLEPTYGVMDEYHEHQSSALYDVIFSGMGVGTAHMDVITTAGFDKTKPCYDMRINAQDVLEGELEDDDLFALIYTTDDTDHWEDSKCWGKANPNLDVSIPMRTMEAFYRKAKQSGSAEINFRTKHLNQWTDSHTRWIAGDIWDTCNKSPISIEGRKAYAGIQLSSTVSLNSFSLCLPRPDGSLDFKVWYWLPEDIANESKELRDSYHKWAGEGWLELTPGNILDYEHIMYRVKQIIEQIKIELIVYPSQYKAYMQPLLDMGIEMENLQNSYTGMTAPINQFPNLVSTGALNHEGNSVLSWQLGRTVIKNGPDNMVKVDMEDSGNVTGVMSALCAFKGYLMKYNVSSPGIY